MAAPSLARAASTPNFSRPVAAPPRPSMRRAATTPQLSSLHDSATFSAYKVWRSSGEQDVVAPWSGFREDSSLWIPEGDTIVILDDGSSADGPCFKIPSSALQELQCQPLLLLAERATGQKVTRPHRKSSTTHRRSAPTVASKRITIPIPSSFGGTAARQAVAVRNFFAWMFNLPLVGEHLGEALADLLRQMDLFRADSCDNVEDLLIYADTAGYSSIDCRADLALAMLHFAEASRLRHVYVDAFAHCVAMHEDLPSSPEFRIISETSKALCARAHLEMDLHVARALKAICTFAEDDTGPALLGLDKAARDHLDVFRSSLQSYYVSKHGYWPPRIDASFPKSTLRSMYSDFTSLYDYLADKNRDRTDRIADGGICVLQNIDAFDKRHSFGALPYRLPLLPSPSDETRSSTQQRALKSIGMKRWSRSRSVQAVHTDLEAATNRENPNTIASPLVRHYVEFESQHGLKPEANLSVNDARKVRWILTYNVLQTLISILQAPPEVRDTDAPYPLCVLTAGTPPWDRPLSHVKSTSESSDDSGRSTEEPNTPVDAKEVKTPAISIHPDCETEDYFDYLKRPVNEPRQPSEPLLSRMSSVGKLARLPSLRTRRGSVRETNTDGGLKISVTAVPEEGGSSSEPQSPQSPRLLMDALASIRNFGLSKLQPPNTAVELEEVPDLEDSHSQTGTDCSGQRQNSLVTARESMYIFQNPNGGRTLGMAYRPTLDSDYTSQKEGVEFQVGFGASEESAARPRTAPARDSVIFSKEFGGDVMGAIWGLVDRSD